MFPYPFSYFSSIVGLKRPFTNRKRLTWFQMIFTSLFLISISMIPVAIQNASLSTYPLSTFIEDVFEPLNDEVMHNLAQSARIEQGEFRYTGQETRYESPTGVVLLQQTKGQSDEKLTLAFETHALRISKQKRELALISYQKITSDSFHDKEALSAAISQDWFQQNRVTISLFLILASGLLLGINFFIISFGAATLLYLTKKSRLFHFKTFKECYNFTINCLGLPTLIATFIGLLGQAMTTIVTIQNILFVLYLVLIFYKTHFRDAAVN